MMKKLPVPNPTKELQKDLPSDYYDMNDPKEVPLTQADIQFAQDIFEMIQEIIDNEYREVSEEFTSNSSLLRHFNNHCLGNKTNRRSSHTNVYYDFTKVNEYKRYEDAVCNILNSADTINIASLYDSKSVINGFRKLFRGNRALTFLYLCGFENNSGPVVVSFRAFSNDVTTNYPRQNTLDCVVRSIRAKTITLYPIAADKVESKFNNFVKNYTANKNITFTINH